MPKNANLWSPWRMTYMAGLASNAQLPRKAEPACFLCEAAADPARFEERLVLLCDERGVVLLNRYPYTSGHLLVTPHDHVANLHEMTPSQRAGLMELMALAEALVQLAYNPQGINVGMNLGSCAGASVPGHAHIHLVPRWNGDTNFMSVVGSVRVIPQALEASYGQLQAALATLQERSS